MSHISNKFDLHQVKYLTEVFLMNTAIAGMDCGERNDLGGNHEDSGNSAEFENKQEE